MEVQGTDGSSVRTGSQKNGNALISSIRQFGKFLGLFATAGRINSANDDEDDTLSTAIINSRAVKSVYRDEDVAIGLAHLTRQQILQESAIRTFSRYDKITQNHLIGLLQ